MDPVMLCGPCCVGHALSMGSMAICPYNLQQPHTHWEGMGGKGMKREGDPFPLLPCPLPSPPSLPLPPLSLSFPSLPPPFLHLDLG